MSKWARYRGAPCEILDVEIPEYPGKRMIKFPDYRETKEDHDGYDYTEPLIMVVDARSLTSSDADPIAKIRNEIDSLETEKRSLSDEVYGLTEEAKKKARSLQELAAKDGNIREFIAYLAEDRPFGVTDDTLRIIETQRHAIYLNHNGDIKTNDGKSISLYRTRDEANSAARSASINRLKNKIEALEAESTASEETK